MAEAEQEQEPKIVELATEITVAWLGNPNVRAGAEEVPAFLKSMHAALAELDRSDARAGGNSAPEYIPAVPVRSSIKPDFLVSLIDGRKFKSLKRHLSTHGLTPQEYRERYGLKPDYPMVAANYSEKRREVAKRLGLGRKPGSGRKGAAPAAAKPASKRRARSKKGGTSAG